MERHQEFSLRIPYQERRTSLDESYAAFFVDRLNRLSNNYTPDLVFNMDKTCSQLFDTRTKAPSVKGSETVKFWSIINEKTTFTAPRAISATGQKLALLRVTTGRTQLSHRHRQILVRISANGISGIGQGRTMYLIESLKEAANRQGRCHNMIRRRQTRNRVRENSHSRD
jgi:hypothetical protein